MCIFLLLACGFDYCHRRIPNWLLALMLAVGMAGAALQEGAQGALYFGCKIALVILCLYFFFKTGTLGAGDVKLFGVCAGYLPGSKILYFLFFSLLIAAFISLLKMLMEQNVKQRLIYLGEYLLEVARSGHWKLYIADRREMRQNGVCLAGPILTSVLMYIGGIF